jgi:hypothetical protein
MSLQVGGFLRVLRVLPPIKLNLTEILLKVVLNTIKPNQTGFMILLVTMD